MARLLCLLFLLLPHAAPWAPASLPVHRSRGPRRSAPRAEQQPAPSQWQLPRLPEVVQDRLERTAIKQNVKQLRMANEAKEAEIERLKEVLGEGRRPGWQGELARATEMLAAAEWKSTEVLLRQLKKVRDPWAFLTKETGAMLRLGSNLSLAYAYGKHGEKLLVHAPAIYARAKELEPHAPGLIRVVDRWFPVIEPHLDEIMERFDQIEPHLPYVIANADSLVPHIGPLLRHLDQLLVYADEDEAHLPALSPYVAYFAPRLDALGPHLPLLRPHLKYLMPHLPTLGRYADNFVPHVAASANADLLVHYFGWCLRIPLLHNVLAIPGVPRLVARVSRILPATPVRGPTGTYACDWEGCDTSYVANAARYYAGIRTCGEEDVQRAILVALGRRAASGNATTLRSAGTPHWLRQWGADSGAPADPDVPFDGL